MTNHPNRSKAHPDCGANFAAAVVKAHVVEEESNQAIAMAMKSTVTTNQKTAFTEIEFVIDGAFSIRFPASTETDLMRDVISKA